MKSEDDAALSAAVLQDSDPSTAAAEEEDEGTPRIEDPAGARNDEAAAPDPPSITASAPLVSPQPSVKVIPKGVPSSKGRGISRQLAVHHTQQAQFQPSDTNTHRQSGIHPVQHKAMRVHPRGFKVLAQWSPMERQLTSYFRLPPLPPQRLQAEGEHVSRMTQMLQTPEEQRSEQALDGFLLLQAAGVEDPLQAVDVLLADRNLTTVVSEDLTFFPNIEFLDLGENQVEMGSLASLTGLQELHLHCNQLAFIDCPSDAFLHLNTLNLSYNFLGPEVFESLLALPRLQRLDLSHNQISYLPDDLSGLDGLTQLALESNGIASEEALHALGTIPSLMEVNLNFNALQRVPRPRPNASANVEVLGLASNRFDFYEDLFPLTEYPNLRRVVLWGNALQRQKPEMERLRKDLAQLDAVVILDGPLPPKKRAVDFYIKNRSRLITLPPWSHWVQPPKPLARHKSGLSGDGSYGSTFFITGGGALDQSVRAELSLAPRDLELTTRLQPQQQQQQQQPREFPPALAGFFSDVSGDLPPPPPDVAHEDSRSVDCSASADLCGQGGDNNPKVVVGRPSRRPTGRVAVAQAQKRHGNVRGAVEELKHLLQKVPVASDVRRPSFLGPAPSTQRPEAVGSQATAAV
eukprot:GGOE01000496.1.p1 GENE.GGOE01000496.1~~GGOE01000496.1.p1  ORF type:complete len:633 (-),score=182.89 GGOE01000496.1:300-2198(-)